MQENLLSFLLMLGAGVFTIVGAVMDWNWFMNNSRARLFVGLFGRLGTRIFYVILGLLLVGLAIFVYLGE